MARVDGASAAGSRALEVGSDVNDPQFNHIMSTCRPGVANLRISRGKLVQRVSQSSPRRTMERTVIESACIHIPKSDVIGMYVLRLCYATSYLSIGWAVIWAGKA